MSALILGNIFTIVIKEWVNYSRLDKMNIVEATALCIIIVLNISCNLTVIYFLINKKRNITFKDKIVASLCSANAGQSIGYITELCALVRGSVNLSACEVKMLNLKI